MDILHRLYHEWQLRRLKRDLAWSMTCAGTIQSRIADIESQAAEHESTLLRLDVPTLPKCGI